RGCRRKWRGRRRGRIGSALSTCRCEGGYTWIAGKTYVIPEDCGVHRVSVVINHAVPCGHGVWWRDDCPTEKLPACHSTVAREHVTRAQLTATEVRACVPRYAHTGRLDVIVRPVRVSLQSIAGCRNHVGNVLLAALR